MTHTKRDPSIDHTHRIRNNSRNRIKTSSEAKLNQEINNFYMFCFYVSFLFFHFKFILFTSLLLSNVSWYLRISIYYPSQHSVFSYDRSGTGMSAVIRNVLQWVCRIFPISQTHTTKFAYRIVHCTGIVKSALWQFITCEFFAFVWPVWYECSPPFRFISKTLFTFQGDFGDKWHIHW